MIRSILKKYIIAAALFLIVIALTAYIIVFHKSYNDEYTPNPDLQINQSVDDAEITGVIHEKIYSVTVKSGDSISKILQKANIDNNSRGQIVQLAKASSIDSKLQIGDEVSFEYYEDANLEQFDNQNDTVNTLRKLSITLGRDAYVDFIKVGNKFHLEHNKVELVKKLNKYHIPIQSNLLNSIRKASLRASNLTKLIESYGKEINLKKQIKRGDSITLLIEQFFTKSGDFVRNGNIIYSSISNNGKKHDLYFYAMSENKSRFFKENGEIISSSNFFKMPLNRVNITSKYGYRTHPIFGCKKMHYGIDMEASSGAPIYSSADGVVTFVGRKGGYGNVVEVKHGTGISTFYAHASKFAKNIKKGSKVKQNEIIAYIGQTGHATRPHLHYEIRVNNKPIDPLKFNKNSISFALDRNQLDDFKRFKSKIQKLTRKSQYTNA